MLNGMLGVLRTGAPWHDLPSRYPPYKICHRRFQQWRRASTLTRLLTKLAEDLRDRGKIDFSETFIDASFSSAPKGALLSARPPRLWESGNRSKATRDGGVSDQTRSEGRCQQSRDSNWRRAAPVSSSWTQTKEK